MMSEFFDCCWIGWRGWRLAGSTAHGRGRAMPTPLVLCAVAATASAALPPNPPGSTDSLRVNAPPVPYALEPLRWGSVRPAGWLLEWASLLREGSGSPKCSAFATLKPQGHSVDGWRGGRCEALPE
jgi:hypothetical protein